MKRYILTLGVLLLAATGLLGAGEAQGFEHFITRQGNKLFDGPKQFRFMGANMPGLVLPYDWTLSLPERLHLPTAWEQEDAFKTLEQMNFRVVRTWNLPMRKPEADAEPYHYITAPGKFNEEAFKVLDNVFALAHKYHVRVILDLTAESGDYLGGIGTYAAYRNKKREAFYTDPQLKEDYKTTVRFVVNRTNTITGVQYKDDKALLGWQFGNEMVNAPDAWLSEMGAYFKSLDTNHLVCETRHRPTTPMLMDGNIDLVTRHLYANYSGISNGWTGLIRDSMAKLDGARPLFIGEFGPYIDNKMFTHQNVVGTLREFLDYIQSEPGIAGALLWSMYFHHDEGGFYWHQIMTYPAVWSYHWPGFPSADAQQEIGIMNAMREAAFKIQGLPVAPVPAPDAPELLPINDAPMMSWRGSAGATGYDIERSAKAEGPWATIATNVSDADVAYRPLFSDDTAQAGETYFYRVIARNASGVSKPSNVVGPVAVTRVCLVDELQDFSRVKGKSEGLKLNNDFNALYGEFLFRAKGTANDWVLYEAGRPIQFVSVYAFYDKELKDLAIQVSQDGTNFTALEPLRIVRKLPSPPRGATTGQSRTMVKYECTITNAPKYLKVIWNGPMELDRVEIYHP